MQDELPLTLVLTYQDVLRLETGLKHYLKESHYLGMEQGPIMTLLAGLQQSLRMHPAHQFHRDEQDAEQQEPPEDMEALRTAYSDSAYKPLK